MGFIRSSGSKVKVKAPKSGSERLELVLEENNNNNNSGHGNPYGDHHQQQQQQQDDGRADADTTAAANYYAPQHQQGEYREHQQQLQPPMQMPSMPSMEHEQQGSLRDGDYYEEPQYYYGDALYPAASNSSASTAETDNRAGSLVRTWTSDGEDSNNGGGTGVDSAVMAEQNAQNRVHFSMETVDEEATNTNNGPVDKKNHRPPAAATAGSGQDNNHDEAPTMAATSTESESDLGSFVSEAVSEADDNHQAEPNNNQAEDGSSRRTEQYRKSVSFDESYNSEAEFEVDLCDEDEEASDGDCSGAQQQDVSDKRSVHSEDVSVESMGWKVKTTWSKESSKKTKKSPMSPVQEQEQEVALPPTTSSSPSPPQVQKTASSRIKGLLKQPKYSLKKNATATSQVVSRGSPSSQSSAGQNSENSSRSSSSNNSGCGSPSNNNLPFHGNGSPNDVSAPSKAIRQKKNPAVRQDSTSSGRTGGSEPVSEVSGCSVETEPEDVPATDDDDMYENENSNVGQQQQPPASQQAAPKRGSASSSRLTPRPPAQRDTARRTVSTLTRHPSYDVQSNNDASGAQSVVSGRSDVAVSPLGVNNHGVNNRRQPQHQRPSPPQSQQQQQQHQHPSAGVPHGQRQPPVNPSPVSGRSDVAVSSPAGVLQEQQRHPPVNPSPQNFFHHRRTLPQDHPSNANNGQRPTLQRQGSNVSSASGVSAYSNAALDGYVDPDESNKKKKNKAGGGRGRGFLRKVRGATPIRSRSGSKSKRQQEKEQLAQQQQQQQQAGKTNQKGQSKQQGKEKKSKLTKSFSLRRTSSLRRNKKSSSGGDKENSGKSKKDQKKKKKKGSARDVYQEDGRDDNDEDNVQPTMSQARSPPAQQQQKQQPSPLSPFTTQYQFEGYDHLKSPRAPSPPGSTYEASPHKTQVQQNANNNNYWPVVDTNDDVNGNNPWANIQNNTASLPTSPSNHRNSGQTQTHTANATNTAPPQSGNQPNLFTSNDGPAPDGQVNLQGSGMPAFKWWSWRQNQNSSSNENDDSKPSQRQEENEEDHATYFAFLCMFPPAVASKMK